MQEKKQEEYLWTIVRSKTKVKDIIIEPIVDCTNGFRAL